MKTYHSILVGEDVKFKQPKKVDPRKVESMNAKKVHEIIDIKASGIFASHSHSFVDIKHPSLLVKKKNFGMTA